MALWYCRPLLCAGWANGQISSCGIGWVRKYGARGLQESWPLRAADCEPNSFENLDYEGRVLVLSPDTLKESCWSPENQLWLAHDGFGCSPHAIGRSIRSTCLGDGEQTRWNRTDFIGVLREELLPDWAKEKLAELQAEQPDMGVMKMT